MKVYISGKITGCEDLNLPKFEAAEELLKSKGYDVINPHKILKYHPSLQWEDYMKADIKELINCDMVAALDDWEESKGAKLEVLLAAQLEIPIISATTLEIIRVKAMPSYTLSYSIAD